MKRRDGLVNLMAELEAHLTGRSPSERMAQSAGPIPEAGTYVLVLFDGLGANQLSHPRAGPLAEANRAVIDAPFPTTTTVSMATVATGLAPRRHGVIAHLLWLPRLGKVVNTLKWMTPFGEQVEYDTTGLLPGPNLWERLRTAGREPVTVQPGNFESTPLTRALYRGCRFEGVWSVDDRIEATADLAAVPGRLVFTYFPEVDFAAHVYGQESKEYAAALSLAAGAWERLARRLPPGVVMVGTSDHGMVDVGEKLLIRDRRYDELRFYGDPRAMMVQGERDLIERLAEEHGAEILDDPPFGDGPEHPQFGERAPDAVLLAPDGAVLLPRGFDKRMLGYHGGLHPDEVGIPLLVAAG